ncbi:MAG: CBS domain-containing protein [Candidatus Altiarchaeota archaeon]
MELRKFLTSDVVTIGSKATLLEVATLMTRKNISSIIVADEGVVSGIITERDFLHLVKDGKNQTEMIAKDLMSSPVITADIKITVEEAATLMHDKGIRQLPITEDGTLAGIITETDIANAIRTVQHDVEIALEETIVETPMTHNLEFGKTYLYLEPKPGNSISAFVDLVKHGTAGLLITRRDPALIAGEWGIDKIPMLWLTDTSPPCHHADPHNVQGISILVSNYLSQACKTVLMMDGISYLITQNRFETVLNLIQNVHDKAVSSKSIFILSLNPETLTKQELELIKQETDETVRRLGPSL